MTCPRGIIFDFDGVLVDTEWAIYQSWVRLYEREGQVLDKATYAPCLGAGYGRWDPAAHLERLAGKPFDWQVETPLRQARIEEDLARMGLMPGVPAMLDWCASQGIGIAVASSSSRRWVGGWLERLGIAGRFQGVFCRTDGYPVKPDPALFMAARQCLGLPAASCLIVEDSENGVLAASRAGIPCVAIPNRMTEGCDFSHASMVKGNMAELLGMLQKAAPCP